MIDYVAGFMFSEDMKTLALIKKDKPKWQAGKLNGIGGKIEPSELPYYAMSREFEEETGVVTNSCDWTQFAKIRGGDDSWLVNFFVTISDKVFDVRTVEREEVLLVSPLSLPDNVIFNLRWLIPLAMDTDISNIMDAIDISHLTHDVN